MHDFDTVADNYLSAWNETDTGQRRAALERGWAPDARYVDPLTSVSGLDQLAEAISSVQATFPGAEFRLLGAVDGHHDRCRFGWELGPAGSYAPVAGFDVIEVLPDGRIASVVGFLDRVPPGAAS